MERQESTLTHKGHCADCGSSDACAHYSDGHTHCFSCGKHRQGEATDNTHRRPRAVSDFSPIQGTVQVLGKRGISEETCRHFGYTVGTDPKTGERVQLAPYCDEHGAVVAQKWRTASKDFGVVGKLKEALPLFGQHLWRDGGKMVVVTEGEIDAMSVSQMQGNKWPVVSVPNGAQGAKKSLQAALEWLERFDTVVLMFDQDDPGREATAECAPLFTPGKCKVAKLPLKDANEMLVAGRGGQIIEAIWGAKPYRPDGIRSVDELAEEAALDVPLGTPWFLPALTALTYGRREGELYGFGAGTGCGKTDLFTQSIAYDVCTLRLRTGVLYLEQPPVETVRRVAGKAAGRVLHVPGKATPAERAEAISLITGDDLLHLYDSFGSNTWENVKAKVRFMAVSLGCKSIYLDNLTALVAAEDDERKALDGIMADMAGLALELKVFLHYVSHLTRPKDGPTHEEGGRVRQSQFRGSNAIGMWTHFLFGIERNTQAEEAVDRQKSTLRCLKDRNTGQATGCVVLLGYCPETGLLSEREADEPDSPFTDTTKDAF